MTSKTTEERKRSFLVKCLEGAIEGFFKTRKRVTFKGELKPEHVEALFKLLGKAVGPKEYMCAFVASSFFHPITAVILDAKRPGILDRQFEVGPGLAGVRFKLKGIEVDMVLDTRLKSGAVFVADFGDSKRWVVLEKQQKSKGA